MDDEYYYNDGIQYSGDVLHYFIKDGINAIQNNGPRHERASIGSFRSYMNLLITESLKYKNNVKILPDCNRYFIPTVANVSGVNIHNIIGSSSRVEPNDDANTIPRAHFDRLIEMLNNEGFISARYKDFVLGYETTGESSFAHKFNTSCSNFHS